MTPQLLMMCLCDKICHALPLNTELNWWAHILRMLWYFAQAEKARRWGQGKKILSLHWSWRRYLWLTDLCQYTSRIWGNVSGKDHDVVAWFGFCHWPLLGTVYQVRRMYDYVWHGYSYRIIESQNHMNRWLQLEWTLKII